MSSASTLVGTTPAARLRPQQEEHHALERLVRFVRDRRETQNTGRD